MLCGTSIEFGGPFASRGAGLGLPFLARWARYPHSPVAAKSCSPGREPWVADELVRTEPRGGDTLPDRCRPHGAVHNLTRSTQGSRPGLHDFAPTGLYEYPAKTGPTGMRRPLILALLLSISVGLPLAAHAQNAAKPAAPVLLDEDKDGLPGASVGPSRAEIEDLIRAIGRDPVSPELVDRIDSVFRPRWASQRKFEDLRAAVADKTFLANMDMLYNEVNKEPGRAGTRALVYRAISVSAAPTIDALREHFRDDAEREAGNWKTLKGRVLGDEIGGKPIAGAVVTSVSGALARTDAKGEFTLKTRPAKAPFPLTITVEAPGRALTQYGFKWDDMADVQAEVFRIPPSVAFGGRVLDPQGKPIAGADLDLSISQDAVCRDGSLARNNFAGLIVMKARTDAEGRYAFRNVPPELEGRQAAGTFSVTHPKFLARSKQYAQNEWLGPGWDITLEPGCVITGTVVDDDGKPVAEAVVRAAFTTDGFVGANPPATTDAEGRFRFENLPKSFVNLTVLPKAHLSTPESVVTKPGEVVDVRIKVPKGEYITGKVIGTDGKPAANVVVGNPLVVEDFGRDQRRESSGNRSARTNEEGAFRLGPIRKGWYQISVLVEPPKIRASIKAEAGGEPVVIELKPDPKDQ